MARRVDTPGQTTPDVVRILFSKQDVRAALIALAEIRGIEVPPQGTLDVRLTDRPGRDYAILEARVPKD